MSEEPGTLRQQSQFRRKRNREYGAKALRDAGVQFESKNNGAHLIVTQMQRVAGVELPLTVDYWPGTGLWIIRGAQDRPDGRGRGIRKLLKYLQK